MWKQKIYSHQDEFKNQQLVKKVIEHPNIKEMFETQAWYYNEFVGDDWDYYMFNVTDEILLEYIKWKNKGDLYFLDKLQHMIIQPKMVEWFAWSRSVWKVAEEKWIDVFSIDWKKYDGINLDIDIEYLTINHVPFVPDIVWGSFDCTTYSIASCSTHRENSITPKTDYAKKCDWVNQNFIKCLNDWLEINPDMEFFLENPVGMLKKMPFMQGFTMHTVWYCQYGDTIAKPTNIWTNSKTWVPRPVCKNHTYDKAWNKTSTHCDHQSARRWSKTWTQWKKWSYERSRIPKELCEEIIQNYLDNR